jgi:hypothetical protein
MSTSIHAALVLAMVACAESSAAPSPPVVSLSAALEPLGNGVSQHVFRARNESPDVLTLIGCPRAPAHYLEGKVVDGDRWFEVASFGVVCQAEQVAEQARLGAGQQLVVRSSGLVAQRITHRFRMLVDDPRGGPPLTFTSNSVLVR